MIYRTLIVSVIFCLFGLPNVVLAASTTGDHTDEDQKAPLVALASSFRSVWPALMEAYIEPNDAAAPLESFASSGLLSTQILHGAPFELFLSADLASITRIEKAGKIQAEPLSLANGSLSLVSGRSNQGLMATELTLASLKVAMRKDPSAKIAIPNPRHAPYGIAAQQALTHVGVWPLPPGTMLSAENASQALQYALNGAVTFAIVPTALLSNHSFDIRSSLVPQSSHESVVHHLAVLNTAGESAKRLVQWLQTPMASSILQQYGLQSPTP